MDVRLPKLGEGAEGGAVVSILVKEGDSISKGQTILELENEKAVAPIPSTVSGVVSQLRVKEGDRILVGQVILSVQEEGAPAAAAGGSSAASTSSTAAPAAKSSKASSTTAGSPARSPKAAAASPDPDAEVDSADDAAEEPAPDGPMPAASPEIRRISRELGLDLRRVRASGPGGRVEWADLRAYLQRLQRHAAQAQAQGGKPATGDGGAAASKPAAAPAESIDFSKWGEISKKPMSVLRKTISRRMAESWNSVPRVTQFDEADITELMELRKKFAPAYEAKGARLTLTSFALRAAALALRKHPIFNSSLDEAKDEIVLKEYVNIGLAVDTEQGLMVPVIRNADKKSLFELSKDVQELAEKARDRKLSLDDMKGGTFTISNQGGIGGAHFTPIVNKPEVAILGLGKGALKAVVRDGAIAPRMLLPVCVAYDHRVIDGGTAARFTVDLVAAFQGFVEADVKL